jgi:hypothetical protein
MKISEHRLPTTQSGKESATCSFDEYYRPGKHTSYNSARGLHLSKYHRELIPLKVTQDRVSSCNKANS